MKLGIKDIDMLHNIHDSLDGTSTLLLGLANYDGVEPDVKSAIDIIADILETDRAEIYRLLRRITKSRSTGQAMSDELVAEQ